MSLTKSRIFMKNLGFYILRKELILINLQDEKWKRV